MGENILDIQKRIVPALIFILVFVLYGNSIKNKYAVDDSYVTVTTPERPNNPRIAQGLKGIPKIFVSHYVESGYQSFDYRPLVLVTFAIEYQFFGSNPHISHLINVLLYAFTCVILFSILCKILKNDNIILPLLITFLFAIHPIHTEVVDNLKCRDELLAFFLGICSLEFFLRNIESKKKIYIFWGILSLCMSFLCKKTAILFLAFIPLTIYFFTQVKIKQILIITVFLLFALLLFKVLTQALIHGVPVSREFAFFENPLYYDHNLIKRIPFAFYTLWYYIKLLIFPYPLCCYYGYNTIPMIEWSSPFFIISFVFHFFIGIYAIKNFSAKNILSYSILIYLIGIFPFSNMFIVNVGIIGERFIYFASLGFCMAVAYLLTVLFNIDIKRRIKINELKLSFRLTFILLMFVFSFLTISRNNDWRDIITLYRNDVQHHENSFYLHYSLAKTLSSQLPKTPSYKKNALKMEILDQFTKSAELLTLGLNEYKSDYYAMTTLGNIYSNSLNNIDLASFYFKKSLLIKPNYYLAQYGLALCYEKRNLLDTAAFLYERMISDNTNYSPVYFNLHEIYIYKKNYLKAIICDKKAIQKCPPEYKIKNYINLGNALMLNGDTSQGILQFKKAADLDPKNFNLYSEYKKR